MRPQTSATNQFAQLAPVAPIEYLQAVLALASDHGLGVAIAEFDLAQRPARGVKLAENDGRSTDRASRRPAGTQITASPDLNRCRCGIEVGLEHRLVTLMR
jgi:hypothetical protein